MHLDAEKTLEVPDLVTPAKEIVLMHQLCGPPRPESVNARHHDQCMAGGERIVAAHDDTIVGCDPPS
jgi:hypothetical protein